MQRPDLDDMDALPAQLPSLQQKRIAAVQQLAAQIREGQSRRMIIPASAHYHETWETGHGTTTRWTSDHAAQEGEIINVESYRADRDQVKVKLRLGDRRTATFIATFDELMGRSRELVSDDIAR